MQKDAWAGNKSAVILMIWKLSINLKRAQVMLLGYIYGLSKHLNNRLTI